MSTLADRIRARRAPQNTPTDTVQPSSAAPATSHPNPHPESGNLATTQSTQQIDVSELTALSLEERTVRFFAYLTENIPVIGDNPLMSSLMKRLGPLFVKELKGMPADQLQEMYKAMFVSLGQVYAPGARAIVIDLHQMHVMIDAVEAAVGLPVVVEDAEPYELVADIHEYELAPPPPPPPSIVEDDDPIIGVELPDGTVVGVKQSEALALRNATK